MESYFIGLDIGGTNIREIEYYVKEQKFSNMLTREFIYGVSAEHEVMSNVITLLDEIVCKNINRKLIGIGISLAASFDRKSGIILKWANNKKWTKFPIKEYLQERYKVPIVLEDDANCAALGEHEYGGGKGKENLIYITISTGIGAGIILNNRLFLGEHGWAGELGHVSVAGENNKCNCGGVGCLQTIASGRGVENAFCKTFVYKKDNMECFSAKNVATLAKKGNKEAKEILYRAGFCIGREICNLSILLDIQLFILGGGLLKVGNPLLHPIYDAVNQIMGGRIKPQIICTKLKGKNGVVGAIVNASRAISDLGLIYPKPSNSKWDLNLEKSAL